MYVRVIDKLIERVLVPLSVLPPTGPTRFDPSGPGHAAIRQLMRRDTGLFPLLDDHLLAFAQGALASRRYNDEIRPILAAIVDVAREQLHPHTVAQNPLCNLLGLLWERFIDTSELLRIARTPEFLGTLTGDHILTLRNAIRIWFCMMAEDDRDLEAFKAKNPDQTVYITVASGLNERTETMLQVGVALFAGLVRSSDVFDAETVAWARRWQADPNTIGDCCLLADPTFSIWSLKEIRLAPADEPDEPAPDIPEESAVMTSSDPRNRLFVGGDVVDLAAIRMHPGNAVKISPKARQILGLEHVTPETTWADLEAAARNDMPAFSAEETLAISECDIDPAGHATYNYGRTFAALHGLGELLNDVGPDNVVLPAHSRTPTFVDLGKLKIRPLHPAFMATAFHELRACYSNPPWGFDAFMTGYVHYSYTHNDAKCSNYTDDLLERLGAQFIGAPRPRRVLVDLERVLAQLSKRIDITASGGLFADVDRLDGAIDFTELLSVLAALATTGARLTELVGPLHAATVIGAPCLDWLARLEDRTLSQLLAQLQRKRPTVLLAVLLEKVADGFTNAPEWFDSWRRLPAQPVAGAVRTTLEGAALADAVAVRDRLSDAFQVISMHLARDPALAASSCNYAQAIWVMFQNSVGQARSNEVRLLRLEAYDHARHNAMTGDASPHLLVFQTTAMMSRWLAQNLAFAASLEGFTAGAIRGPTFSLAFNVHDESFHRIKRLREAMASLDRTQLPPYHRLLCECIKGLLGTRLRIAEATSLCINKDVFTPYFTQFIGQDEEGNTVDEFQDPVKDWCSTALVSVFNATKGQQIPAPVWDEFDRLLARFV